MRNNLAAAGLFTLAALAADDPKKPAGEPPKVVCALPVGVPPGTSKFTVRGVKLDTATEVRFGEPKSSGKILSKKSVGVPTPADIPRLGNTEAEVEMTLPAGLHARSVPISFVGPGGVSNAGRLLLLGDLTVVKEKEPNDGFRQAQPLVVPVAVQGTIQSAQDVDVFRIDVPAGKRLVAEVHAARYGTPLDARLTLYNAAGSEVAVSDDHAGSADARLDVRIKQAGAWFVSLVDALDGGGPAYGYCLVVSVED